MSDHNNKRKLKDDKQTIRKRKKRKILNKLINDKKERINKVTKIAKDLGLVLWEFTNRHFATDKFIEPKDMVEVATSKKWLMSGIGFCKILGIKFATKHAEAKLMMKYIYEAGKNPFVFAQKDIEAVNFPEEVTVVRSAKNGNGFRKSKSCRECHKLMMLCGVNCVTYSYGTSGRRFKTEKLTEMKSRPSKGTVSLLKK